MGVEGEVKAKDAVGIFVVGGDELGDVGKGRGGTKDDENATCVADARNVEELGTWPNSTRAWLPPKKVLRIFGGLCLRDDHAVKVGLP